MSQLFATALLLTLGAGSAGLFAVSNQPTLASSLNSGSVQTTGALSSRAAKSALAVYLAQVEPEVESVGQAQGGEAIAANICADLPDWQRPSDLAQIKQLESMPNYGEALQSDPLAELAKAWWSNNFFSFTTYGLSARTDPLYLSGLWTAIDDTWDCYSADQPEQINRGELAELWLLHHRLVNLVWQDQQYLATVEPTEKGLQLVQFPRREQDQGLPLSIVTTTGQALAVMSGDW